MAPKTEIGPVPHLSERQMIALTFLHERQIDGDAPPSEEEIGRRCGCTPPNAHKILTRLAELRLIRMAAGKHRGVRLNYQEAAPVLFLADVRRVFAASSKTPSLTARRAGLPEQVCSGVLGAYSAWCQEAMCVSAEG
jgi:DNA-binding IscR family transcriptional regulator